MEYIARNAMNPQTGAPHPPATIETAMEEARIHIDPFKSVEAQVPGVLEVIRPLIPIRFDKVRIAVKESGENYGRCYEDFKHFDKITKEEWQKDGSWIGVVEMPAGDGLPREDKQQDARGGRHEDSEGRCLSDLDRAREGFGAPVLVDQKF